MLPWAVYFKSNPAQSSALASLTHSKHLVNWADLVKLCRLHTWRI